MKRILMIFITLILLCIIYLVIEGRNVQEIKTEIEVSASPSKVWSIIIDINQWQEWSPIINDSKGEAAIGSKLSITMIGKEKGKNGPQYSPMIAELREPRYFRWRAHMVSGFVFTNDKIFELEETNSGTRLIHTETFSGLIAPVMRGQVEDSVPAMLNAMNRALKEMAEK